MVIVKREGLFDVMKKNSKGGKMKNKEELRFAFWVVAIIVLVIVLVAGIYGFIVESIGWWR